MRLRRFRVRTLLIAVAIAAFLLESAGMVRQCAKARQRAGECEQWLAAWRQECEIARRFYILNLKQHPELARIMEGEINLTSATIQYYFYMKTE
jgi:hypothetical protein